MYQVQKQPVPYKHTEERRLKFAEPKYKVPNRPVLNSIISIARRL